MRLAPVSVVIPVGPRRAGLSRALRSVFAQTVLPAEVIVVHDGRPIDSDEPPPTAPTGISLIDLTHPFRRGAPAARNSGLDRATQTYVAFLDSDDEWAADKLEVELDAVGSAVGVVSGAQRLRDGQVQAVDARSGCDTFARALAFEGWTVPVGSSLTVRRIGSPWWDETLPAMQDWDYLLQLLNGDVRVVPEILATNHQTTGGMRVFSGDRRATGLARVAIKYRGALRANAAADAVMRDKLHLQASRAHTAEARRECLVALQTLTGQTRWRVATAVNAVAPHLTGPWLRGQRWSGRARRRLSSLTYRGES